MPAQNSATFPPAPRRKGLAIKYPETVHIQDAQLTAAKVSNPRFRGKLRKFCRQFKGHFSIGNVPGSNPPRAARQSAFQRISSLNSRKARQWRAFQTVESLRLRHLRTFSAKTLETLQPNSIKF